MNTKLSTSISLTLVDQDGQELPLRTSINHPFELWIPRDPQFNMPSMHLQNVTSISPHPSSSSLLFNLHHIDLTKLVNVSIHFELQPIQKNLSFLLIYRFDRSPIFNRSMRLIDGWTLFCSSSKTIQDFVWYWSSPFFEIGRMIVSTRISLTMSKPPVIIRSFLVSVNWALSLMLHHQVHRRSPNDCLSLPTIDFVSLLLLVIISTTTTNGVPTESEPVSPLLPLSLSHVFSIRLDLWAITVTLNVSPLIWPASPVDSQSYLHRWTGTMSLPMLTSWRTKPFIWLWSLSRLSTFSSCSMRVIGIEKIFKKYVDRVERCNSERLLFLVGCHTNARQSSRGRIFLRDRCLHRSTQRSRNEIESTLIRPPKLHSRSALDLGLLCFVRREWSDRYSTLGRSSSTDLSTSKHRCFRPGCAQVRFSLPG